MPSFEAARRAGANGLLVTVESIFRVHRERVVGLARSFGLPSVFSEQLFVEADGLMSYDADRRALMIRSADYVDKLLKGARPQDLPIEQPTVFSIAINLRTARALDIPIPPAILARATDVIE